MIISKWIGPTYKKIKKEHSDGEITMLIYHGHIYEKLALETFQSVS